VCKYEFKESFVWASDTYLSNCIAPNISKLFSPELGAVLAKPLIYAAIQRTSKLDPNVALLSDELRSRILNSLAISGGYTIDHIPQIIERVPIVVTGAGGELDLVEVGLEERVSSNRIGRSDNAVINELCAISAHTGDQTST
jgi:hypothetical protein